VAKLSSVLVDLALKMALPVIPILFIFRLRRNKLSASLEFPHEMGRQDILLAVR